MQTISIKKDCFLQRLYAVILSLKHPFENTVVHTGGKKMGYGREMWLSRYEEIPEKVVSGQLDREGAIAEMRALGFSKEEAVEQLDETFDWSTEPPTQMDTMT